MPTRSRVSAGLRFSKVFPVEDSTHSPSLKFFNTRVCVLLRSAGVAKVSVAMMMSPYARNNECSNLLMLQLAGKERQGRAEATCCSLRIRSVIPCFGCIRLGLSVGSLSIQGVRFRLSLGSLSFCCVRLSLDLAPCHFIR